MKHEGKVFVGKSNIEVLFTANANEEAREARNLFCSKLKKKINDRFPDSSTSVLKKCSFIGMRPLSFLSGDEVEAYGTDEIDQLAHEYGSPLKNAEGHLVEPIIVTMRSWNGLW